ncbi:MAG: hypothetical protein QOH26_914, partial [Actinomycetota bacterium]|nr:hypothetical protein [Actinomycetota bacterium]
MIDRRRAIHRPGLALLSLIVLLPACTTESAGDATVTTNAPETLRKGDDLDVTVEGIRDHLKALQKIASANEGIRAAGEPGYDASVRYVARTMRAAGYEVSFDAWRTPIFEQRSPTRLEPEGSARGTFEDGQDLRAMLYSGSGSIRAPLFPLSFDAEGTGREGPGCSPNAFDGTPAGAVVLLRPGPCFTRDQVVNAQQAGAGAVIVAYPEFTPGNGLRRPTLLSPDGIAIPALAVTDEVGRRLSALGSGTSVRVAVDARNPTRLLRNVIAETPGGSALKVVMAGGHLDSVVDGPGINDNGSGVATLIEIAEELIGSEPRNKVRFVFWAGEEYGLLGSRHYVDSLNPLEIRDIAVYLNFDMLASPN